MARQDIKITADHSANVPYLRDAANPDLLGDRHQVGGRADRGDFPCDHADAGLHRTRGQMDGAVLQEEIESHCTHSVRAESVEALTLIPARRG